MGKKHHRIPRKTSKVASLISLLPIWQLMLAYPMTEQSVGHLMSQYHGQEVISRTEAQQTLKHEDVTRLKQKHSCQANNHASFDVLLRDATKIRAKRMKLRHKRGPVSW